MTDIAFVKGHGTENDFVLVPDLDDARALSPEQVSWLADRHAGIGGDGVIRVARTETATEDFVRQQSGEARFFMDYRNADGSAAEMCGNGVRVLAQYLRTHGLETAESFSVATRGGVKHVRVVEDGFAVDMGAWRFTHFDKAREFGHDTLVHVDGHEPFAAISLDLGNPHTVVALPPEVDLDALDLTRAPELNPVAPQGSNVEFVQILGNGHIRMRVHERGVGETRSCGTGACAAALATSYWATSQVEEHESWSVDVPGGTLRVTALPGQHVELAGPAVLVAEGTVRL
ncbi:MAG: diaminopimelate epimerase [Intrasporangiaceae bacterium]|nr:diaminopimelate epimerase [Intrasporangiaceae bacterium]